MNAVAQELPIRVARPATGSAAPAVMALTDVHKAYGSGAARVSASLPQYELPAAAPPQGMGLLWACGAGPPRS